jgi:ABC-type nitrate/sulfonate/bicarbonate transport system substrate-binding protein
LRRADCEAVPLGQPQDLLALNEGYHLLRLSTEVVPDFLYTVTAVRRPWAETHKDTLVRYVRALGRGVHIHPRSRETEFGDKDDR